MMGPDSRRLPRLWSSLLADCTTALVTGVVLLLLALSLGLLTSLVILMTSSTVQQLLGLPW